MGKSDTKTMQNMKQLITLGVVITLIIAVLIFSSSPGGSSATEPTAIEQLPAVQQIDTEFDLDVIEAVNERDIFDSTIPTSEGDDNLFNRI